MTSKPAQLQFAASYQDEVIPTLPGIMISAVDEISRRCARALISFWIRLNSRN